jgi:hypothetical protein
MLKTVGKQGANSLMSFVARLSAGQSDPAILCGRTAALRHRAALDVQLAHGTGALHARALRGRNQQKAGSVNVSQLLPGDGTVACVGRHRSPQTRSGARHRLARGAETENFARVKLTLNFAFGLVQIISYAGRFPAVIEDAVRVATLVVREGSPLRIVPIPHLIALKLYAGGYKSKADIVELLVRNPDLDLDEVRTVCARYGLDGLEELIAESRSV